MWIFLSLSFLSFNFALFLFSKYFIQAPMSNLGKITQIVGPVVDVIFDDEGSTLPSIYDALTVDNNGNQIV